MLLARTISARSRRTCFAERNRTGIKPEQAEHVFDPFVTSKPQGTGMGLAVRRSIVESHGGRLWATPNPGPGTTFHFTLPIETAASELA